MTVAKAGAERLEAGQTEHAENEDRVEDQIGDRRCGERIEEQVGFAACDDEAVKDPLAHLPEGEQNIA